VHADVSELAYKCYHKIHSPLQEHEGFSVRSPLCLYSDPPVMRTSRCDDPSRCLVSLPAPRPGEQVSPLADAGDRGGDIPGPTEIVTQAASANASRVVPCVTSSCCVLAALIVLRRMVNEIIVAFLVFVSLLLMLLLLLFV
jgi:hypothetical protein